MDIDSKILNSIKERFRSCGDIANELCEQKHRIAMRLIKLKMRSLVYEIQGDNGGSGVQPKKYKVVPKI